MTDLLIASIVPLLQKTHKASAALRNVKTAQKNDFLQHLSGLLLSNIPFIEAENKKDVAAMDPSNPKVDRLVLNASRIEALAHSILDIVELSDPVGKVLSEKTMYNGIHQVKKSVPLGVVGVIFESRPNVTIDVSALCLKAGNAVVLKGGSEAIHTNSALVQLIKKALVAANLPANAVNLLPVGREFVTEMLQATAYIDVIIPRGSDNLIQFVRKNSLVPTIETGAGVCHTYVHQEANLNNAVAIVVNAKTTRVSVCNALDTIVVDASVAEKFLTMLAPKLAEFNVEIFADSTSYTYLDNYPYLQKAQAEDFGREFLDFKCSVKVVENFQEALSHIEAYSSKHSEAIVSENNEICEQFMDSVDAAAVYANASTRFTDGGEFGLGAEIGISTQKLHARGPFALEKMVTEKWYLYGEGQIR
jgi:glutamate-5-semialdehyde dehydrogenase